MQNDKMLVMRFLHNFPSVALLELKYQKSLLRLKNKLNFNTYLSILLLLDISKIFIISHKKTLYIYKLALKTILELLKILSLSNKFSIKFFITIFLL